MINNKLKMRISRKKFWRMKSMISKKLKNKSMPMKISRFKRCKITSKC